jgi:hypothetical protein
MINGQEYQAGTTEITITTDDGQELTLSRWNKVEYKTGAKKQPANRADGKLDAYTIGKQETSGTLSTRLSEFYDIEQWLLSIYPTMGILQIELTMVVTYGNSLAKLKKDTVRFMFDEITKPTDDGQGVNKVDLPLFVFDVLSNGARPVIYAD